MPDTSTENGLRVLLFGKSGAGKSSLLGALMQASHGQPQTLGAPLADTEGNLTELQKHTYDNKLESTHEEIVRYPLSWQLPDDQGGARPVTLIDCDGHVAEQYLTGQRPIEENAPLAKAVQDADSLVLVVDASAGAPQLEQTFKSFAEFLRLFEKHRGRHNEIAGLPVYLVLAKCDLLARKDDTNSVWMQRIEEGKRKIDKRFQDALAQEAKRQDVPFGKIDLHLWATATRRPALADRPAKPQEPYGVAELFRQVLTSARDHQEHRSAASRWLRTAVLGILGVLGVLGLLAAGFFLTRPTSERAALEKSIRQMLPGTGTSADFLRGNLEEKTKALARIQESAEFANLPQDMQREVKHAVEEIEAYQQFSKKAADLGLIHHLKTEKEVEQRLKQLDDLELPEPYAKSWEKTAAAQKLQRQREELTALLQAIQSEQTWFQTQTAEGDKLRKRIPVAGTAEHKTWDTQVEDYLRRKEPHRESETLEKVPAITYGKLYQFPTVRTVREQWRDVRMKLETIRKALQ